MSIKEGDGDLSTYIIENANWVKDSKITQTSLLVKDDKISAIRDRFSYYRYMRMDVSSFMMTPGHVMCDLEVPEGTDFAVYDTVLIWCEQFSVLFGSAEIS